MTVAITYNSERISTLLAGQTATIACKGRKMSGDIVVEGACTIVYNSTTLAELEENQKATIRCKGKVMLSPVIVEAKKEQPEETYTVSGTWELNEFVKDERICEEVIFISNGNAFNSIWIANANVYYGDTCVTSNPMIDEEYQIDTEYRAIIFDGEQTVSEEFYDWFTANATCVNPEGSDEGEQTYTLCGTWVFNETLICSSKSESYEQNCSFTSNGDTCTGFSVIADAYATSSNTTCYAKLYYYGMSVDDAYDKIEWGGWYDEAYRTITFDGAQTVSEEFYEWFIANAYEVNHAGGAN